MLFVYGSLLFPEVLQALLHRVPDRKPAVAEGWRVVALEERPYPGLVPVAGQAHGMLVTGLTADEWQILDAFEDDIYELLRLDVTDGRHGWAYVCPAEAHTARTDWHADQFVARHLGAYIGACVAWRQRYDATPCRLS